MRFKINIKLFDYPVYFYIGEEEKEKFQKDFKLKDIDKDTYGYVYANMVWISDKDDIEIIVHECHHAKYELTKTRGIKDEETEAYILGYLVKNVIKKIKEIENKVLKQSKLIQEK